ncbi:phosphoenolpyruvate--protein phosphotransferase [Eubacterium callanderi]|uniref:phosphoenolpyruvate--protein phosphotransferase n=1 Tax=Eubacterium callanderi TaxID=53442 RepID=UPI001C128695|nr:phosphoenolpyruvate--protein phosphotransferase [Eubacterium callanderi]MBU5302139.1 phosphoenolpyruvate--protein phosphotransferase [Eubacterium callanderi]WPK66513.1 Phosphoenolpyruvate-protein phosphotransferase [Eubacterium callanderi]WPK70811.1 Phosphoenolpyruvate-protein phosphotransferase [Eubacterium callanderi]
MLKEGIIASPGIAIAKAFVYDKVEVEVTEKKVDDPAAEVARLQAALEKSKEQILKIKEKAARDLGEEEAEIFEAHAMVLDDPEFVDSITAEINTNGVNAEFAVKTVTDRFFEMFDMMDDPYFSARAADIRDVGTRVLNNVMGVENVDISCLDEDTIIVADDLAPSDTAQMDKARVKGFATNIGSRTSHTAIMARSLEIPAVLGLGDITAAVKNGDTVVVDGLKGQAVINPTEDELAAYKKQQEDYQAYIKELAELKELEAVTTDGHKVELVGNIGSPNDTDGVHKNGGRGVGLYRTEFLYMNSDTMPDEEKQYEAYKAVIESFDGDPVIIRTLDIGGDKKLPYLPLEEEMNPFLGFRAIRLCFREVDMFKTQLRAILRASAFGNALIMFPMISGVSEVRQAKGILAECMKELDEKGQAYDKNIRVGVMIEIPSAAVTSDIIAREVDFFSIGTNDLCQYTLAVDRMNQEVSYLYNPLHPAILRLVKTVIDASHAREGLFTGMCGEMAGDPMATLILLGLGMDEFSMSASSIPQVKKIIRSVSYEDAKAIAEKALNLETGEEVKEMVQAKIAELGIKIV